MSHAVWCDLPGDCERGIDQCPDQRRSKFGQSLSKPGRALLHKVWDMIGGEWGYDAADQAMFEFETAIMAVEAHAK